MRGNPTLYLTAHLVTRSIPAYAGEPFSPKVMAAII